MSSQPDPLVGRILGRYRVVTSLRRGGMGVVYLARHTLLDKPFALKVLRMESADDQAMVGRFKREAQSLSRLTHPNTVTVTDFGATEDGLLFLVMEFLEGVTCADVLKNSGPFPAERVIHTAIGVCDALSEAHALGIVHRDVKPNNLLLTKVGQTYDHVKLIDFGLAKQAVEPDGDEAEVTRAGLLIGTPQYMSPEQIQGKDIDARTDLYGLGITLFRLLTGRHPFEQTQIAALFHAHLSEPPPAASELAPADAVADLDLDEVIRKLLAKEQAARYQTAAEAKAGLEACATAGTWDQASAEESYDAAKVYTLELDIGGLLEADRKRELNEVDEAPTLMHEMSSPSMQTPASGPLATTSGPVPQQSGVSPLDSRPSYPNGEMVDGSGQSWPGAAAPHALSWRRVAVTALAALVLAFLGGSAAMWLRDSRHPPAEAGPLATTLPPPPSPAAAPLAAPAPEAGETATASAKPEPKVEEAPSRIVTIAVTSNPAGASVTSGKVGLGATPLTVTRPREDREVTLALELVGYRKATRTIDLVAVPSDRHEIVVNLAKIPPKEAAQKQKRAKSGSRSKATAASSTAPWKSGRSSSGPKKKRKKKAATPKSSDFQTID